MAFFINVALESLQLGMAVHPFEFLTRFSKKADCMITLDIVKKEQVRLLVSGFNFENYELSSARELTGR